MAVSNISAITRLLPSSDSTGLAANFVESQQMAMFVESQRMAMFIESQKMAMVAEIQRMAMLAEIQRMMTSAPPTAQAQKRSHPFILPRVASHDWVRVEEEKQAALKISEEFNSHLAPRIGASVPEPKGTSKRIGSGFYRALTAEEAQVSALILQYRGNFSQVAKVLDTTPLRINRIWNAIEFFLWEKEHDDILLKLIKENGDKDWGSLVTLFSQKVGRYVSLPRVLKRIQYLHKIPASELSRKKPKNQQVRTKKSGYVCLLTEEESRFADLLFQYRGDYNVVANILGKTDLEIERLWSKIKPFPWKKEHDETLREMIHQSKSGETLTQEFSFKVGRYVSYNQIRAHIRNNKIFFSRAPKGVPSLDQSIDKPVSNPTLSGPFDELFAANPSILANTEEGFDPLYEGLPGFEEALLLCDEEEDVTALQVTQPASDQSASDLSALPSISPLLACGAPSQSFPTNTLFRDQGSGESSLARYFGNLSPLSEPLSDMFPQEDLDSSSSHGPLKQKRRESSELEKAKKARTSIHVQSTVSMTNTFLFLPGEADALSSLLPSAGGSATSICVAPSLLPSFNVEHASRSVTSICGLPIVDPLRFEKRV